MIGFYVGLHRMVALMIRGIVEVSFAGANNETIELGKGGENLSHKQPHAMLSEWSLNIYFSFVVEQAIGIK